MPRPLFADRLCLFATLSALSALSAFAQIAPVIPPPPAPTPAIAPTPTIPNRSAPPDDYPDRPALPLDAAEDLEDKPIDLEDPDTAAPSDPYLRQPMPPIRKRSVRVEGVGTIKFLMTEPRNRVGGQRYPLIVALPGGDGAERLGRGLLQLWWARPAAARGYYVITPIAKRGMPFHQSGTELVMPLVEEVRRELPIADDMIFIAGASNGGVGAVRLAIDHPDAFAGLVGVPAGADRPETLDQVQKLKNMPVYLRAAQGDPANFDAQAERLAQRLRQAGAQVNFEIIPGTGNLPRLNLTDLFTWLDSIVARQRDLNEQPGVLRSIVITTQPASRPSPTPTEPSGD